MARHWPAWIVAGCIIGLGFAIADIVGTHRTVNRLVCAQDPKCQNAAERSRANTQRLADLRPIVAELQRRQDKLIAAGIAAGLKGRVGPRGHRGRSGERGRAGREGSEGPRGLRGLTGATGAKGRTGAVGPRGPRGPSGLPGPAGDAGATAAEVLALICKNGGLPPALCASLVEPLSK